MTTLNPSNAIGFAQFRLRGGWRTLLWAAGIYTVAIGGLIFGTVNVFAASGIGYSGWVYGLLALQVAILLFFGTIRVGGAVRADLVSGMIESHRLMPTPPAAAMFGYMFGATSHVLALGAANVLLGVLATVNAGLPPSLWIAANAVLIWFTFCVWAVATLFAFGPRGIAALFYLPLVTIGTTQGALMSLLPGVTVLVTPLAAGSIFSNWAFSVSAQAYPLMLGGIAQGLLAAICFAGACRKYRRADVPALTAPMGLALLAIWIGATIIAMRQWELFRPRYFPGNFISPVTQVTASMIVAMLVSLFPTAAAMRAHAEWRRRRRRHDPATGRRPLPILLVVLTATALTVSLTGVAFEKSWPWFPEDFIGRFLHLAAIVGVSLLGPAYLLGIFYRGGGRGALPVIIWLFLVWLLPLVIDFALHIGDPTGMQDFPGAIASASPPVAIYRVLQINVNGTMPGIVGQAALTAALAGMYYRRAARRASSLPQPQN